MPPKRPGVFVWRVPPCRIAGFRASSIDDLGIRYALRCMVLYGLGEGGCATFEVLVLFDVNLQAIYVRVGLSSDRFR